MPQRRLAKIISIGLLCCAAFGSAAFAQVPRLIRYQGFLKDSQGVALEGNYNLTFRLYTAVTGGTPVWTEPQQTTPISAGSFSVLLGSVIPLDTMDWSVPLWLSIQVNTDVELSPRQQITSVPLAIRAQDAEHLTQPITPALITPQGSGSSLDADTVDGKHASELLSRSNQTGTQPASTISPQGTGSGLDADSLDGKDASQFASSTHGHQCSHYNNMLPSNSKASDFCAQRGQWCVLALTAGGRDTISCDTVNPGFGDWGAVCCR